MSRALLWGWRPRPLACPFRPVRRLSRQPGPEDAAESESSRPIPFSSSKASPRVWSVDRSMGSDYQRPWVKVLPVSLLGIGLLLWCVFREEAEVDKQLGAVFHEQVPGLVDETPEDKVLPPSQQEKC
ncbi:chromosome 16 orf 91 [Chelydra serpentina]|uniref:Protein CCSMST1 n=1 Tax=Chelydra serpentina TaxID=8475 RepID=A0A8T1S1K9_CHESE|nr:chromosome 16 orf 91 [Chelydra serpentina]